MVDRVASTIARNARGNDVTVATLKGEADYYPKIIDHLNETESVEYLILLTTNNGFAVEPAEVYSLDDVDERLEDTESSEHRLNVMALSDERVILLSGDSGHTESQCMEIQLDSIESIHGSTESDSHTVRILTSEEVYTISTAKFKRLSDFRDAMAFLSSSIKTEHQRVE